MSVLTNLEMEDTVNKKIKKDIVMWVVFLIGGEGVVKIGCATKRVDFLLIGLILIIGSIISLYCLYSQSDKENDNNHE